ncbi:HipA domain-containing protein [Labilibacter sediminis]|nr:HipA domain-containing protein [Labilibacter sediminis]
MATKRIYVFADWHNLTDTTLMGVLNVEQIRGHEVFSFEYDKDWLKSSNRLLLDPDLQWYSGPQFLTDNKENYGLFLDSSPDRWGRVLMRRREAIMARSEDRPQKTLFASDYLLGVYDEHRMGALRFKEDLTGPFLNDNKQMAAPPWTSLRELEYASLKIEADDAMDDPEYLNWLNLLTAPGSSLGGARPKASVLDEKGNLWIAKFPSLNDDTDIGGWEMVVHELALQSGIQMAPSMIKKFSSKNHTFLTKRFDRINQGKRIHFASAMTLLGMQDGDNFQSGASYLDIVEFIIQHGNKGTIQNDLEQLWRRIVFGICVKNTDDHLRNHGFLLGEQGWELSPAYDINPVAFGTGLSLNITDDDNSLNLQLAIEVAEFFRIDNNKAIDIINQVKNTVSNWRHVATKYNLSRNEQELMSLAFESH